MMLVALCEVCVMDYFSYKGDELFAEGVSLNELAKEYGTPLYVYSKIC